MSFFLSFLRCLYFISPWSDATAATRGREQVKKEKETTNDAVASRVIIFFLLLLLLLLLLLFVYFCQWNYNNSVSPLPLPHRELDMGGGAQKGPTLPQHPTLPSSVESRFVLLTRNAIRPPAPSVRRFVSAPLSRRSPRDVDALHYIYFLFPVRTRTTRQHIRKKERKKERKEP